MTHSQETLTALDIYYTPSVAETAVFYLTLVINLLALVLIAYAIWFRKYPPMRAEHVWITAVVGIGGVIFNIANNIAQGMARYNGFLGVCDFWGAWMLFTFGLGLMMSAINMRLVLFYRIFITGNTYTSAQFSIANFFRRFWPFFAIWSTTIISSIVMSALDGHKGMWLLEDHGLRACLFSNEYLYWIFVFEAVQVILSWALYFRMRSVAKAFNGFKMAIWTLVIFTALLVVNAVINLIRGSDKPWGRIVIALTNLVLINGYLLLILGKPVVGHMFWREQAMRDFMNNIHQDAIIAQKINVPGFAKAGILSSQNNHVVGQYLYQSDSHELDNDRDSKYALQQYSKTHQAASVYSTTLGYEVDNYTNLQQHSQEPHISSPADITYSENTKRVL